MKRATTSMLLAMSIMTMATNAEARNGTGVDAQENLFGATNINAVTGHGRLTVGISAEGDVTVLSWPTPSLSDQLGYLSSNDVDARDQPRFGAPEGAGITLGLACDDGDGEEVTWLRDGTAWAREQDYGPDDGPNPHTRFTNDELGLQVVVVDAVAPESDTFVRQVTVERDAASPVVTCAMLTHANLSPTPPNSRLAELPIVDWALDGRNDFAAIWDSADDAVVHFHPSDQRIYSKIGDVVGGPDVDYGPIGTALGSTTPDIDALLATVSDDYGAGAWLTLTTVPAPSEHQVGFDNTDFCGHVEGVVDNIEALPDRFPGFEPPLDPSALNLLKCDENSGPDVVAAQGWTYAATNPWTDLQDGTLEGAGLAAAETSSALRTPLTFDQDLATASLVLGAGSNLTEARAALASGTAEPEMVATQAKQAVDAWLAGLYIPGTEGTPAHTVAKRSLVNLRVGTDAESGTIVASISRQPPYYLDWPRDGAFFNVMLDASGQSTLVDDRINLYAEWQRKEPVNPTPLLDPMPPEDPDTGMALSYPAHAWEMNHYADGTAGGTFRFEIDTTAFAVWTAVAHVGWVDDPQSYLEGHWEMIQTGTDLLARWRDAETGLHAPAQEDDQANYSQTLHGAITVFGALDVAARAARLLGEDTKAQQWEARALELREAMRASFYDEEDEVFFMQESGRLPLQASGQTAVGPTAWLVWPMTLYPLDDPVIERQLARDLELIEPALTLEAVGGLYYMKNTISLAIGGSEAFDDTIPTLPELLAAQATDTHHFGEVMVVDDSGPQPQPLQRVSTPHLWEGSLFYLTAVAVEDPDALLRYEEVLPPSNVRPRQEPDEGDPTPGMDMGTGPTPDTGGSDDDAGGDAAPDAGIGEVRGAQCACSSTPSPMPMSLLLLVAALVAHRLRRGSA